MTAIMQPSPEWITRVQEHFAAEGLRQTTRDEFEAIPEGLRAGIPHLQDHSAPFGFRPPAEAEIAAFYDRLAPHYDTLTMVDYDLEVYSTAWLGEEIERRHPHHIVDGGCGTGITLALLSRHCTPSGGTLFGYDASRRMVDRAGTRVARHRRGGGRVGVHRATHTALVQHDLLPRGDTDLLFTKCSFGAGVFEIPAFSEAPSPSLARDDFYGSDPTMLAWRENLTAFGSVLRPGGTYIHIGVLADGPMEAITWMAEDVGFRLVTEDPVWFEHRPRPTEAFITAFGRELAEIGVPADQHPKVISHHWNWTAPALGALVFTRQ